MQIRLTTSAADFIDTWERYAWMGMTVIFIMLYALGGKAGYNLSAAVEEEDVGRALTGDILSFGGIIFGSCAGWAPVSSFHRLTLTLDI